MSGVRAFRVEDIGEVADLWLEVFRGIDARSSKALQDYFRKIFFDSPWREEDLPSLVYEEAGRGIVGFMGVLPRRMMLGSRPLRVAVATQLMVRENASFPAIRLMRAYLNGAQDLSFSDGANISAERLWQASGGAVALLDSLTWTRVLRPSQYLLTLLNRRRRLGPLSAGAWPLCRALDSAAVRSRLGRRYWLTEPKDSALDEAPDDDTLLWCNRHFAGQRALLPRYDAADWRWLLREAAEKRKYGALKRGLVRDAGGAIIGWYLYYAKEGGIAQVLQLGGWRKSIRSVLAHLFSAAWRDGAVAVSGKLEAGFANELVQSRCSFGLPGYVALMHSREPDIINAIYRGDAFLTRLEGEWWARFSDPEWSVSGVSHANPRPDAAVLTETPRLTSAHY